MGCPHENNAIYIKESINDLSFNINCRECAKLYYENMNFKCEYAENYWRMEHELQE